VDFYSDSGILKDSCWQEIFPPCIFSPSLVFMIQISWEIL